MFCYGKIEGFEKVRKGKLKKILNSISELISKIDIL